MWAHFRHLCSKNFSMILKTFQFNGFWPLQSLSEDSGVHQDSNPKVGAHLGMWGFIPSHSLAFLGAWNVTPELHTWPTPSQTLALVMSPRLGLRNIWYTPFFKKNWLIINSNLTKSYKKFRIVCFGFNPVLVVERIEVVFWSFLEIIMNRISLSQTIMEILRYNALAL